MSEEKEIIINGIDVSEYFIEVVDEGGSTIDYKILPNRERLLVEKIFKQNQQFKRLQEENKRLQMLSCANCGEKYLSPDGAELYEKNVQLQKENEKQKELIKQLEDFIKTDGEIDHINHEYTYKLQKENEKLKANKGRCAFKCLDNTFCDEAKIKIDKLELDKDCLNASLETARKYRGIAETDRDKYKQALEEIRGFAEKLITETPEYHSCYYKDECGDKCTPKQQNKVTYCCYENVEKIENLINEVLNVENN